LFTKRWRDAIRCLHPFAIASFCLTALPWYLICASRNPDFFRVFIIEHNFNRFLTPNSSISSRSGIHSHCPSRNFPMDIFPCIGKAPISRQLDPTQAGKPFPSFLLAWAGFIFCFSLWPNQSCRVTSCRLSRPWHCSWQTRPLPPQKHGRRSPLPLMGTGLGLLIFGVVLQRQAQRIPSLDYASHAGGLSLLWATAVLGGLAYVSWQPAADYESVCSQPFSRPCSWWLK